MPTPNLPHDRPVSLNDRFQFHCTGCAVCCRHIKEGVPLDSLDAYRLTKYLRSQGIGPTCTDDVLMRFGEPVPITDSGYFSYFLKTVGDDDSCIFLNGNRCAVHEAKPTACRLYPIEAAPEKDGVFQIVLCTEKPHHFSGPTHKVKNWFYRNMPEDVRAFYRFDFEHAPKIHLLLMAVPDEKKAAALLLFHKYRYSDFALDKPFMPQFTANIKNLICELEKLVQE